MKEGKQPGKACMVRLPEDLYQMLKALAEANDRPISRELCRAVTAWVEAATGPGKPSPGA